jgi:hypothetical protein
MSHLRLQARDSFGNAVTGGGGGGGGGRFQMAVKMMTPACAEMRASSMPTHTAEARDDEDGTYTLKWSADVAGEYELSNPRPNPTPTPAVWFAMAMRTMAGEYEIHISMEHAPICGSPFRCYVASGFARPPKEGEAIKAVLSTLQGEGRAPDGCPGTQAAVVEGQLLCMGSMLPQPTATIRRPSAHLCQFPAQYGNSAEFLKRAPPVARWRSTLLKMDTMPSLSLVS